MPGSAEGPLAQLARRGGSVVIYRRGANPVMESLIDLYYAGYRSGSSTIVGAVGRDVVRSDRAAGAMSTRGWRDEGHYWRRSWVVANDADRARVQRDLEEAVAALAPRTKDQYEFQYRPPGEETDGGYAQVGCLYALLSVGAGWLVGGVAVVWAGVPLPWFEVGVLVAILGLGAGFALLGFLPRLVALAPWTRAAAVVIALWSMLVLPALPVLALWLVAAALAPIDATAVWLALLGVGLVAGLAGAALWYSDRRGKRERASERRDARESPSSGPPMEQGEPETQDAHPASELWSRALDGLVNDPALVGFVVFQGSRGYVQFTVVDDELYGEAVSNAHLPEDAQLSGAQEDALERLGWGGGDVSANYQRRWSVPIDVRRVARLTAATLAVYGDDPTEVSISTDKADA